MKLAFGMLLIRSRLSHFNKGKYHKGTNTPAALELMRTAAQDGSLGLSDDRVHIAVVITDGRPNIKHYGITISEGHRRTEIAGKLLRRARIFKLILCYWHSRRTPLITKRNFC